MPIEFLSRLEDLPAEPTHINEPANGAQRLGRWASWLTIGRLPSPVPRGGVCLNITLIPSLLSSDPSLPKLSLALVTLLLLPGVARVKS